MSEDIGTGLDLLPTESHLDPSVSVGVATWCRADTGRRWNRHHVPRGRLVPRMLGMRGAIINVIWAPWSVIWPITSG